MIFDNVVERDIFIPFFQKKLCRHRDYQLFSFFPDTYFLAWSCLKSIVMLNLRSIAARRLAKNSPLDCFYTAMQCRSLCFSIYT
ncbi:MAG: hypothetical protein SPK18_10105, partial [Treponema sp.]|nr:hypothetical protein [Treponema sp.]MDY5758920.1 hypothetical protein [Treponema sp.]